VILSPNHFRKTANSMPLNIEYLFTTLYILTIYTYFEILETKPLSRCRWFINGSIWDNGVEHTHTQTQAAWSVSIKLSTLFTTFLSSAHKGRTSVSYIGQEKKIHHIEGSPKCFCCREKPAETQTLAHWLASPLVRAPEFESPALTEINAL
jgi:hypothetical protein